MTTLTTRPSTPRLSEAARHVVIPKGIVTTAWPRIVAQCEDMGVTFDPWQHGIGSIALGKRKDGKYAATVGGIVLSIPRQVGKTFLVGMIVIALCVIFPGMTVLWTAHRTRTATKTFQSLQAMVKRKKVRPHIRAIRTANGEQEIAFRNGSVIMFGAREQGFGRGFDEVDVGVFDEAQILTEKALEDIVPAANQSRQEAGALLFFMGTPPRPSDPGEEFTNRRTKALSGKSSDMFFVEMSADPDADPDDHAQWAKANPSFPRRTPVESMQRMRENLTNVDSFKREALGIWDDGVKTSTLPKWKDRCVDVQLGIPNAIGLAASPDHSWGSIGACGIVDGKPVVGAVRRERGTAWLVSEALRIQRENNCMVAVDKGGPLHDLIDDLQAAGVSVTLLDTADYLDACAEIVRRVEDDDITQPGHPELDAAVDGAAWRWVGDRRAFARKSSDVSMLEAVTIALWGSNRGGVIMW